MVLLDTPVVKVFTSPSTLLEKPCTPVTIDAARADPGRLTRPPEVPGELAGAAGRKPGS